MNKKNDIVSLVFHATFCIQVVWSCNSMLGRLALPFQSQLSICCAYKAKTVMAYTWPMLESVSFVVITIIVFSIVARL